MASLALVFSSLPENWLIKVITSFCGQY